MARKLQSRACHSEWTSDIAMMPTSPCESLCQGSSFALCWLLCSLLPFPQALDSEVEQVPGLSCLDRPPSHVGGPELLHLLSACACFARASPSDRLFLVQALQQAGGGVAACGTGSHLWQGSSPLLSFGVTWYPVLHCPGGRVSSSGASRMPWVSARMGFFTFEHIVTGPLTTLYLLSTLVPAELSDAPVVAAADVGVALGPAVDAVHNAASVVSLRPSADRLPLLFRHSRGTVAAIRKAVAFSCGARLALATLMLLGVAVDRWGLHCGEGSGEGGQGGFWPEAGYNSRPLFVGRLLWKDPASLPPLLVPPRP